MNRTFMVSTVFLATVAAALPTRAQTPLQHGIPLGSVFGAVGVDTHVAYNDGFGLYAYPQDIGNAMQYLGLNQIRDGVAENYPATANYDELTNAPYNLKLQVILPDWQDALSVDLSYLDSMFTTGAYGGSGTVPLGAVSVVEGLNEITNENPQPTQSQATSWQQEISCLTATFSYCAAAGVPSPDSNVAGEGVAMFTGNTAVITPTSSPSSTFPATYGNIHPYYYATSVGTETPYQEITSAVDQTYGFTPSPVNSVEGQTANPTGLVMSESGAASSGANTAIYGTDTSSTDPYFNLKFDDRTTAVYDLDTILDGLATNQRVFLYQLFANYTFAQSTDETYGLFRYSGATNSDGSPGYSPTEAAMAVHTLTSLASGAETTAEGTDCVEYSLSGLPSGSGHSILAQYGDGTFALFLWNEGTDWNPSTSTEVAQAEASVSANFMYGVSGYVTNLLTGAVTSFANGSTSVSAEIGDAPQAIVFTTSEPSDDACSQ